MRITIVLAVVVALICTSVHAGEILADGPFAGIDLSSLPEQQAEILRSANEDFVLVQNGRLPRNAVKDEETPLPSDGGTTFYRARGYSR